MGNMKVVMFCMLSVIIGTYTLGIKSAENKNFQSSIDRSNQIQVEEITKTGLQMALDDLACDPYVRTLQPKTYVYTKIVLGDTVRYTIDPNDTFDKATVRVWSQYNGVKATVKAKVSVRAYPYISIYWWNNVYRGRWDVDKIYVYPG
ncbi:MAG: hypothetical protein HY089_11415 [Ignavibacteriales bacterium]|nr:hypothetical protein [Ignavibacteriales bacterium]